MASSYELESDLSENQVEAFVSAYLAWSSCGVKPNLLYSINEQITGADKVLNKIHGFSIYIQFKKSHGLKTVNSCPINRKKLGLKNKIREFRFNKKFIEDKILYFQLRAKAKTAQDFQHNILKAHHSPQNSQYAIYVAPLHLMRQEYEDYLFDVNNQSGTVSFSSVRNYSRLKSELNQNCSVSSSFLPEHISIVPHEVVSDDKHFYAYSDKGQNITWHSPSIFEQPEPSNLADFLKYVFTEAVDKNEKTPLSELARNVQLIGKEYGFEYKSESPIKVLREYDKWLYDNYKIKQFIFVPHDDFQNLGFPQLLF